MRTWLAVSTLLIAVTASIGARATSAGVVPHSSRQDAVAEAAGAKADEPVTTASGLVYQIVRHGTGPAAKPGQHVVIHETVALADGRVVFSTRTKDRPVKFLLGGKQVIDGVDEGVTGMKVGERRKLVVPPSLSRRSIPSAGVSAEATLHYDIELVEIVQE
jgi:FKBP-type peptidyl-prolyl cis-trans isomerase